MALPDKPSNKAPPNHQTVVFFSAIAGDGVIVGCGMGVGVAVGEGVTAVSIAALTIYDMAKAVDRGMTITDVHLAYKAGGKSGEWREARGE